MAATGGQRNSAGRDSGRSREQILPLTTVGKIMKKVLPEKARITKEAKERIQECASKFVTFITERAAQDCKNEGRSEIDGGDIILAMSSLGFHDYVGPLQNYLRELWNIDELMNEPEPETSISPTPEWHLHRFHDGGEYPNGILGVGAAESFQHLAALILRKIY